MAEIVNPRHAEAGIVAHCPPAHPKTVLAPAIGVLRKQKRIGTSPAGQRVDICPGSVTEQHCARAGFAVAKTNMQLSKCKLILTILFY